ncbi:hypothetical protein NHX12_003002, partial [Muraenolepis orangiensis]
MAGEKGPSKQRSTMDIKRLAGLIQRGTGRLLVIDSRTFSEYNASHVQGALNVCCSKLVKRRLQQDKVSVTELLQPNVKGKVELGRKQEVVVYDQSSKEVGHLSKDGFLHILMGKLEGSFYRVSLLTAYVLRGMPLDVVITPAEDCFWPELRGSDMRLKIRVRRMKEARELRGSRSVFSQHCEAETQCNRLAFITRVRPHFQLLPSSLLSRRCPPERERLAASGPTHPRGGFAAFSSCFPGLCEGKPATTLPISLSQPCLSVANVGLTRILPHLYLGSQKDVLNKDLMAQNGITYVLNASNTCPKPDFISETHFMRIPVNDNYCEKLLPWLEKTNQFIDKAKVSNCRVIVHCLAGISRSATIAIAYIMKTMGLSSDDAYRFVKDRRPSISPNFNFLGQLLEFEKGLRLLQALGSGPEDQGPEGRGARQASELHGGSPGDTGEALVSAEPKLPSPTSLQHGFNGLHLSAERLVDTNRLKRSFSLDIKSVYSPSGPHCQRLVPTHSEDVPKLCKLDSPGTAGVCPQFSAAPDSPGYLESPFPSPACGGGSIGGLGAHLPLGPSPGGRSPGSDESLKGSLLLALPSLPGPASGAMWTKHRDTVQATTPFGSSSAYVAFGCSEGGVRMRDKSPPPQQREHRGTP